MLKLDLSKLSAFLPDDYASTRKQALEQAHGAGFRPRPHEAGKDGNIRTVPFAGSAERTEKAYTDAPGTV